MDIDRCSHSYLLNTKDFATCFQTTKQMFSQLKVKRGVVTLYTFGARNMMRRRRGALKVRYNPRSIFKYYFKEEIEFGGRHTWDLRY